MRSTLAHVAASERRVRGRDLCLFSHDASCLAVCGADGEVKIWDGATNQLVAKFSPGGARGWSVTAAAWAKQREHVSSRAKARLFAPLRRSFSPLLLSLPFHSHYSTHGGVKGGGRRLPLSPPWQSEGGVKGGRLGRGGRRGREAAGQ